MKRVLLADLAVAAVTASADQEQGSGAGNVVFRRNVSLVRADAQVLDARGRAVTGLHREEFLLREAGREREIPNFASENMPVDVLILIDVSTSMRPRVERVAAASQGALRVLGPEDRVGMMVFDRRTRLRSPFRNAQSAEAMGEFGRLLNQEYFSGGTDITRALLDAAQYVRRDGRKDARRAIVILTDDQTEFDRDEPRVVQAMTQADAVVSLLLAPDAMGRFSGGGGAGGSWPNGGGGLGTIGDILLGGGTRFPGGSGRRYPRPGGGGGGRGGTQPAGTRIIAADTGGDTIEIDDASALATTLERIRQRYALYFIAPEGVRAGEERNITVELAGSARRRYGNAGVRYRRTYIVPEGSGGATPAEVTQTAPPPTTTTTASGSGSGEPAPPTTRRRPAVN
ncbi:MAG: VWA domain-containing protein [Acidobacteria bacterium]|nr:VWA domain-containing protein [Acidobacteriota bacterium]